MRSIRSIRCIRFHRSARFVRLAVPLASFALPSLVPIYPALADTDPPADIRFTGESGGAEDLFGWSAAAAGDVNGDGFADLVIGAPSCDELQGFAGRAYLFYGPFTGDRLAANADATISAVTFGEVLMTGAKVGAPTVSGASVTGEMISTFGVVDEHVTPLITCVVGLPAASVSLAVTLNVPSPCVVIVPEGTVTVAWSQNRGRPATLPAVPSKRSRAPTTR